ncbi:TonB-dependent receptor plug domain-containing protein [Myxococcus sp. K38C18041901]|uniref:TonB-dependent receptor plug domain-containing protein n=1 Tax=Myxococcus guangdongensis TaxID=2906760 RepID=UPI0020A6F61E|nr:TonB-dependent receptor plug domain-containing protein [Myxococcus guangdongensis]MCP3061205.1 TonB-dependent receptor plug domain-containing protein [Myxococcus guangdongensis]
MGAPLSASAQEAGGSVATDLESLSLENLLETKVATGSFLELDLRRSPVSVDIIQRNQIEASGARHLGELLEVFVPGFQTMVNKWNGVVWGMRGVAPDRNTKIIFCINGVKQNTESRDGASTEVELGLLGDISHVEVLRGPAGLVYGSGAIAGVVNVVTRTPTTNSMSVKVGYGLGHARQLEVLSNVRLFSGGDLTLSVGGRDAEGYGLRSGRVYGNNSWPNASAPSMSGYATDGSPWSTPGNLRVSADYRQGNFRFYARFTRQQISAGPYFLVDPFPGIAGSPADDVPGTVVDGEVITPDHPLRHAETWDNGRRVFRMDNVFADASYSRQFGEDTLQGRLTVSGTTNQTLIERREGYGVAGSNATPAGGIQGTMGERRYGGSLLYHLRRVDKLESVVGIDARVDDIGADLAGRNFSGPDTHPALAGVNYLTLAAFTENQYNLTPNLALVAGLRAMKHSRTDLVLSPKGAVVFTPTETDSVKLIVQSSANTGSADTYEWSAKHYSNAGVLQTGAHLLDETNALSNQVPAQTLADLHSLKPEQTLSAELASAHRLPLGVTLLPSVSFNRVFNLIAWNQALFRPINAAPYNFVSAELSAHWGWRMVQAGGSHVFQRLVGKRPNNTTITVPAYAAVDRGDGTFGLEELPGETREVTVSPLNDQVTRNGKDFLNLATHTSKLWLTVTPLSGLTFHTSARVFWGLRGREDLYAADQALGYNYLDVATAPIVKWNAGVLVDVTKEVRVGLHGYDLLGSATSRHAVRWQQMAELPQRDVFTVDQRTVMATLEARL